MNILYLTISYTPNGNGLYNDLINSLISRGHHVTIVRADNKAKKTYVEKVNDQLTLLNVKVGNPFEKNIIKKGINQILLAKYFLRAIKKNLRERTFDLILYATPPITLCSVIAFCKRYYKAKTFLMLKDIFPQNAVDLCLISKKSLTYLFFRKKEKNIINIPIILGVCRRGTWIMLKKHNREIDEEKLHIFPNSIQIEEIDGLKFNNKVTQFVFGGNLGKPQNIKFLISVIYKLRHYDNAKFIIIGRGTELDYIKQFCNINSNNNLRILDYLPVNEYEEILKTSDVGLISLDHRFTIPNIPSRFQSYLKLKKPVLAITDVNTDLKNMIEENDCGWWCNAASEDSIIETIKLICENKEMQIRKGINGFSYLKREFDILRNTEEIERFMGI